MRGSRGAACLSPHLITAPTTILNFHYQAVFEDDCSQLIGEADLLNKIMEIV